MCQATWSLGHPAMNLSRRQAKFSSFSTSASSCWFQFVVVKNKASLFSSVFMQLFIFSLSLVSGRDLFRCSRPFFPLNCSYFLQFITVSCPLFLFHTVPSCHWAHLLHPAVNYGAGLQTGMQLRVHLTHWPTLVMSFPSHWSKSQSHSSPEFSQLIYSPLPFPKSRYCKLCKDFSLYLL